mgnify:CR=1 FL=1
MRRLFSIVRNGISFPRRVVSVVEASAISLDSAFTKEKALASHSLTLLREKMSRRAARQLVSHGHFMLNGKRVNIPSIAVKPGDKIEVRAKSTKSAYFANLSEVVKNSVQKPLSWLKADHKKMVIEITGLPKREEAEDDINEQLIVEFYSR